MEPSYFCVTLPPCIFLCIAEKNQFNNNLCGNVLFFSSDYFSRAIYLIGELSLFKMVLEVLRWMYSKYGMVCAVRTKIKPNSTCSSFGAIFFLNIFCAEIKRCMAKKIICLQYNTYIKPALYTHNYQLVKIIIWIRILTHSK